MTEAAANALLKALEEPGASTIWLLCAPTFHDVLPTIRSRCRQLNLKTPTKGEITRYLIESFQVSEDKAELAANISQGHIGKAKGFLKNDTTRGTRKKTFDLLLSIKSEGDAIRAVDEILKLAQEQVETRFYSLIESEAEEMKAVMQSSTRGMISGSAKALKELEKDQKARTTRAIKDQLDGILLDYITFFRDCLAVSGPLVNSDLTEQIQKKAKALGEGPITELISRISYTRELLTTNASQTLLLESLFTYYAQVNCGN
jgi:DNA polymerase-3 subunit delta'